MGESMIYGILNENGVVDRRILADQEFMDAKFPGQYVLIGPDLPPDTWVLTKVAMISRFTPQEYVGIISATKTDVEVQAWYDLFQAASTVDLKDQRTIAGINSLVGKNLLTQARADEILSTPAQSNEKP
jgi:hypothetical protein